MGLRITGMLTMIGALAGFFIGLSVPRTFEGHATLRFIRLPGMPQDMYDRESRTMLDSAAAGVMTSDALSSFIRQNSRFRERLSFEPAEDVIERIRKGTRIEFANLPGGSKGIEVRYEDEDADDALDTTRELAVQLARLAKGAAILTDGQEVTELAGLPVVAPSGLTLRWFTAAGFLGGLAVGLMAWMVGGVAILRRRLN